MPIIQSNVKKRHFNQQTKLEPTNSTMKKEITRPVNGFNASGYTVSVEEKDDTSVHEGDIFVEFED